METQQQQTPPIQASKFSIDLNTFTTWTKTIFTIIFFIFYLSIFVYSTFSKNYVPNFALFKDFLTNHESMFTNFNRYINTIMKEKMNTNISKLEEKIKKLKEDSRASSEDLHRKHEELKTKLDAKCPETPLKPPPSFVAAMEPPPASTMGCGRSRESFVSYSSRMDDLKEKETNTKEPTKEKPETYSIQDYMNRVLLNTLYVNKNTVYSK